MNCRFTVVTLRPSVDSLGRKNKSPSMSSNSGQQQIYETGVEKEGRKVKMGKGFHPAADVTCRTEGNTVWEEGMVVVGPFNPPQQERGDCILKLSSHDKSSVTLSAFEHRVSDHLCAAWSDLQYKTDTCTFFLHLTHLFVFKMSTFRTTYQRNKGGVWRRGDRTDPLRDWKSHGWLRQDNQSRYHRTKDGQRHQATQGQIWSYGHLLYFNIYRLHVCSISKNVLCTFPQLDPSIYESLQKERVEVGDVIYIEANSGAVKVFLNQTF